VRNGDAFRVILMQPAPNVPIVDGGAQPTKDAVLLGYLIEVCTCFLWEISFKSSKLNFLNDKINDWNTLHLPLSLQLRPP